MRACMDDRGAIALESLARNTMRSPIVMINMTTVFWKCLVMG